MVDNAVSPKVAEALKKSGHDCVHVREVGLRDSSDEKIFARAVEDGRHLITADTDFGSLAVRSRSTVPSVLLLRIQPSTVEEDAMYILKAIGSLVSEIERGCVVSIHRSGMRVRTLPIAGERHE